MINNIEQIEKLYQHIHKITLRIGYFIENNQLKKIREMLDKRIILFDEVNEIIENRTFSNEEKAKINSIINNYKLIENENITRLETKQKEIGKKLGNIHCGKKALSAYKTSKSVRPRLIDRKE